MTSGRAARVAHARGWVRLASFSLPPKRAIAIALPIHAGIMQLYPVYDSALFWSEMSD